MHQPITFSHTNKSALHRLMQSAYLIIALALAGAALPPAAKALNPNTVLGDQAFVSNTTGSNDTALGYFSLNLNTTGLNNVGVGAVTLRNNTTGSANTACGYAGLYANTTANSNTALGHAALTNNTTGSFNVACGAGALYANTTASDNTATGFDALSNNTTGTQNTAMAFGALGGNTTGNYNTATGFNALTTNTTGDSNTAQGTNALYHNTAGDLNTATGDRALFSNTIGSNNLANGAGALFRNTTGNNNMATGANALYGNTTGYFNMANGSFAMVHNTTGTYNVAEGLNALFNNTTGSNNIAVGLASGGNLTTGNNNIDIGNRGVAGESSRIRLGTKGVQTSTFIAGISGVAVAGGVGVMINSNGQLGTVVSSARFKEEIKPMDKASEAILALEPVTFRYKEALDPEGIPQFGLVAEEVEQVDPDLVARDEKGKPYTVRYEAVNAMLLNEFLKEHRRVEEQVRKQQEQEATISELKSAVTQQQKDFQSTVGQQENEIKALSAILKEQAMQLRKMNAQLEVSKAAPELVASNQ